MEKMQNILKVLVTLTTIFGAVKATVNTTQQNQKGLLPYSLRTNAAIQQLGKGVLLNLVGSFPQVMANTSMAEACLSDTGKLLGDIIQFKMYALQFLDAEGKLPPGVFQGGKYWVGDYQKCHAIQSEVNILTGHSFKGKYFTLALSILSGPLKALGEINIGLCLPDTCHIKDVKAIGEKVLELVGTKALGVHFVIEDNDMDFDAAAISLFVITGIVGILVLLGTAVELSPMVINRKSVYPADEAKRDTVNNELKRANGHLPNNLIMQHADEPPKPSRLKAFLLCFSFLNNTRKLLNTKTATGPLSCLNGLRVVSMWWVIQGHTYLFSTLTSSNPAIARPVTERFTFQAILNGNFSVDTFFFLSGLLVAYLTLREIKIKGKMNWIYYFCHRYWRLTPLYAYVMLIFIVVTVYMPGGPFQWLIANQRGILFHASDSCRTYWWSNLIYINNFYPGYGNTGECMGWGWYLANDMQFYVFICPIIILLYKYRKLAGITSGVFLVIACVVIRAVIVSYYGIIGPSSAPTKHIDDPWGKNGAMYTRPWARMSVYVVGILTGVLLQNKNCRIRMSKLTVLIGWCVATGSALAVLYGVYSYNHNGTKMSGVATGFYKSLNRTVWSLSLSWVVIACASGYGGPVNFVLSWKLWAPLGRLTFAAYLVHPIIMFAYQLTLLTPLQFTDLTLIYLFVSNLVFSYLFGYVVSMFVEAPMMGLEKLLLPVPKANPKKMKKGSLNPGVSVIGYEAKM